MFKPQDHDSLGTFVQKLVKKGEFGRVNVIRPFKVKARIGRVPGWLG